MVTIEIRLTAATMRLQAEFVDDAGNDLADAELGRMMVEHFLAAPGVRAACLGVKIEVDGEDGSC